MMLICVTGHYQLRADAFDPCKQAIDRFVKHVQANEPGTLAYVACQDANDPTRFMHGAVFEDEAARQAHENSDAVKAFVDVLYPRAVEPVRFTEYRVIASKGG